MSASAIELADVEWAIEVLERRRESLVAFAPVFWRPAPDASARHRAFIEHLLSGGGAVGFRTNDAVLVAVPRGEEWLVDDLHVPPESWDWDDGRALWNALDGVAHGAQVRFVCPTYEEGRGEFARAVGLRMVESWWLLELPNGATGGEADVRVDLVGLEGVTVAAPPVYDPGGPVLYVPSFDGSPAPLATAIERAPQLGCPAIVISQVVGDVAGEKALADAGFRRHCDYYSGTIDPVETSHA